METNTTLWIASADTARLRFPSGITESKPPARPCVEGQLHIPHPPPRTLRTLQGRTCRAGVHTGHRRSGMQARSGMRARSASARGTGKNSPFPRDNGTSRSASRGVLRGCPTRGGWGVALPPTRGWGDTACGALRRGAHGAAPCRRGPAPAHGGGAEERSLPVLSASRMW